jgi:C4-dicarboxylate-specific signal transduction histidine kinase
MQGNKVSIGECSSDMEHELRVSQLCFIGKILSLFTHEINNHLAILKESAGLMEDLIEFGGGSRSKQDSGQYLQISHSMHTQVRKTMTLLKYLNRFGHRFDHEMSSFNLNESLEELLVLIQRSVNQKRITIEKEFDNNIPAVRSSPSQLQLLVFSLLEEKIRRLDDRSSISVKTSHSGGKITISILAQGNMTDKTKEHTFCSGKLLQDVIAKMGWSITETEKAGTAITLPMSVP